MKNNLINQLLLCMMFLGSLIATAIPGVGVAVREALKLAEARSGRVIAETSARESAELVLERSVTKFGNKALAAAGEGGLELVEATIKYGDDVMKFAVEATPAARRVFALKAETLLPLVRRVGPEALELEAKAPGLAGKMFATFGDDAGKIISKTVPTDDLPRLLAYAEMADTQATRELLLKTYQKEGKTMFERIPAKLVLAGGLTAAMLYGTHNITRPIGKALNDHPDIVRHVLNHAVTISGIVLSLIAIILLWRFDLVPWHRKRKGMPPHPSKPSEAVKRLPENRVE